jgi:hypothetical protein
MMESASAEVALVGVDVVAEDGKKAAFVHL